MALTQVKALGLAADSIDETKLADDSIDSEHYNDGSIDTAHLADDAVTLAKMASGTDGQIITFDASGNPTAVGPGSDGQVLTSTGAGSPPAFEAIPSSGAALTGSTNNTVVTVTGANAIAGEANLVFDGTHLGVGTSSAAVVSGGPGLVVHGTTAPRIRLTNDTTGEAGTDGSELSLDGSTKDLWIENREEADIRFAVNGSERAQIDSAGRFGIANSTMSSAHADADDLVIGTSSSNPVGISILGANDGYGCINWGDASDNDVARISYNHNGDIFSVTTNAAERIRQTSNITRIGQFSTVNGTNGGLDIEWTGGTSKRSYLQSYTAHTTANESLMSFGNGNGLSGKIVVSDGDVNFADASDYRLKQDQADITDGITRVKQLKPCSFKWKVNTDVTVEGFYAHEVQSIVPQAVVGEKDAVNSKGEIDPQLLKPVNLIPVLTAALKEAIAKIETLETKVAALEG